MSLREATVGGVLALLAPACISPPQEDPNRSHAVEPSCVDPGRHDPGPGPFASPRDFEQSGCTLGSLEGVDLTGLWSYAQDNRGIFFGSGVLTFEQTCEEGLEVRLGSSTSSVDIRDRVLTGSDLFWRRERVFEGQEGDVRLIDAQNLCALGDDGALVGRAVRCFASGESEDCEVTGVSLERLERLEGEGVAQGLELVSEFSGAAWSWRRHFTANVRVHEDVAYLARDEDGLRIVDVSDLKHPREIGHVPASEGEAFNDIKIVVHRAEDLDSPFALVASNERGMLVYDLSSPGEPQLVAAVTPTGEPNHGIHTLFTEEIDGEPIAYVADGFTNLVTIWSLADPVVPARIGAFEASDPDWAVHDLFASEGRMYLNATTGGLLIVDTQPNPGDPRVVGRYVDSNTERYSHSNWVTEVDGRRVTVSGDEGYDAHFRIIDVDPESSTFLQELGTYQTRPAVSAHNVMAFGTKAYAAYYQDGIRVLDISDPQNPELEAYFNTWEPRFSRGARFEGAVGIDVDRGRGLIFVADYPRGLMILRETAGR